MGYPMHQTSTPDGKLNRFSRVLERQRRKSEREQDENDRQAAASVLMDLSNFMNCSDSSCDADTEVTPPQEYLLQGSSSSKVVFLFYHMMQVVSDVIEPSHNVYIFFIY